MKFSTTHCTGCGTCELACSFHHKGKFHPSTSSIEIIEKYTEMGFEIVVYVKPENGHTACDGCLELERPFCVKYCPVIARDELQEIIISRILSKKEP